MNYERKILPISVLALNNGQIPNVGENPREITNDGLERLIESIKKFPDMLELRELIVYPCGGEFVAIGGNQRLKALRELGVKEVACKILPENTPAKKLREIVIKDNLEVGKWSDKILQSGWSLPELGEFSFDTSTLNFGDSFAMKKDEYDVEEQDLPEELEGVDLEPDDYERIKGEDETENERIILVYLKSQENKILEFLGLKEITKVVYPIEEIPAINK